MMTMIIVRDIWFQTKPDLFCADQNQNGEPGPPGPWEIPLACLLPSDALIKMGSWVKMASGPLTRGPWEILPAGWCWLDSIVSPSVHPAQLNISQPWLHKSAHQWREMFGQIQIFLTHCPQSPPLPMGTARWFSIFSPIVQMPPLAWFLHTSDDLHRKLTCTITVVIDKGLTKGSLRMPKVHFI